MSIITRTDVTAVKFYNNYVLAGIGNEVNVFDKRYNSFVCKQDVLTGQKIYGFVISKCRQKVLVFGGKQFTVLLLKPLECINKIEMFKRCFVPVLCDDWLHSALWVDEKTVAVLTSHNVVQKWDISTAKLISSHPSKDNSILYSGLLLSLENDVLVMAGTVSSEVIIHKCDDEEPLHRLTGHKGVIFSISCEPDKNLIVTTSDDRSVRVWGPNTVPEHANNSIDYWENLEIVCKHELYGHQARVMRSCITNCYVVSVGEDSTICVWDFEGSLVKKITAHQNACIWAVDNINDLLVTGGGDCGVIIHPLAVATEYSCSQIIDANIGIPKKIVLTARGNVVILNESDNLIHYNAENQDAIIYKLNHESTYKLMSISSCKQIIAVGDMNGTLNVFAENCKYEAGLINVIDTKLNFGKILSMHWAGNRHLVMCSENGIINVVAYTTTTAVYDNFTLPLCKERWLTSAAVDSQANIFILGDRCGNVHVYMKGKQDPVISFSKVHGRYGPTSITVKDTEVVTTGRNGTIKYFHFDPSTNVFRYMDRKDLDFQWVEKFIDKNQNMVCGFQERIFVVHNIKDNSIVLEECCGGGHRSWDAQRFIAKVKDKYDQIIQLVYVKNSEIHLKKYFLNKLMPINLINGSHSKEINCLKIYRNFLDKKTYYISGGEDTTLRVSSLDNVLIFKDEFVFKQLSSVRTLCIYPINSYNVLIISGGGRAQINIRDIKFSKPQGKVEVKSLELVDYLVKGTDKERKGNQSWKTCTVDFDPETRVMDLDIIRDSYIFAGCSDAVLRIFTYNDTLQLVKEVKYHETCILKTHCFKFCEQNILITATTRGDVAFWLADNVEDDFKPFFVLKTRKSGVNGMDIDVLNETTFILATGGDDNCLLLQLLRVSDPEDLNSLALESSWSSTSHHSSQITGVTLFRIYDKKELITLPTDYCYTPPSDDGMELNNLNLPRVPYTRNTLDFALECPMSPYYMYKARDYLEEDLALYLEAKAQASGAASKAAALEDSASNGAASGLSTRQRRSQIAAPPRVTQHRCSNDSELISSWLTGTDPNSLLNSRIPGFDDQFDSTFFELDEPVFPVSENDVTESDDLNTSTSPETQQNCKEPDDTLKEGYLLTTSIDQRITLFKWSVCRGINCVYETQIYSNVADIQGLEIVETSRDSVTVCVFGKGLEVIEVPVSI